MVHPTELLRTNSTGDEGSFVAPVGDYREDVDCGCKVLPCLNQRLNLDKYAKPRYFVGLLSLTGVFSGLAVKYFRGTSQIWSQHYGISQDTIDWLIYINEIFVGLFALVVAYWGNKIHRPKWLGALAIYFGASCITLIVPEIYQPYKTEETDINTVNGRVLCEISTFQEIIEDTSMVNNQIVAFGILVMYQIVFALFTISFTTHGITYIDDNISPKHSPAFIALAYAAQRMGKHSGLYSAWLPYIFGSQNIFVSAVWIMVAVHLIMFGCFVAMFPKVLPNTSLRKSVNSLLSVASGNAVVESEQKVDGFFKSLWRIVKNKVLILNILSTMLMQAAIINFNIQEKPFNQSKYHVSKYNDASGYTDPTLIQYSTNLLKQPLIALSYVAMGMVIAKMKPSGKFLAMFNTKVFIFVLLGFAGVRFFNCTNKIRNEVSGRLTIPYCSWNCGCSLDGPFQPICLNGETHFSPCWAGCTAFDASLKIYQNCTCGDGSKNIAAEGSCDSDSCSTLWALAQAQGVIASALLGATFITTLIINLRCVLQKDKALALGLHITCVTLFAYLPVRAIYDVIADNFCQMWGKKACQFYSNNYALLLVIITIIFKTLAVLASIGLIFVIDKVDLYTNYSRRNSNLSFLRRPGVIHSNTYQADSAINDGESEAETPNEARALVHQPAENVLRSKQQSESKIDKLGDRTSKEERMNAYLSEGDLVPPLRTNLRLGKSASRTSNSQNSEISNGSSLSAIANTVGDDHDSDYPTLSRSQENRRDDEDNTNSSRSRVTYSVPVGTNLQETEF